MVVQRAAVDESRRHDRNLAHGQFGAEGMFLQDRLVAPASGPVELHHTHRPVVDAELIDPVLEAVERQQAAVGCDADAFQRIEHAFRGQVGERRCVLSQGDARWSWCFIVAGRGVHKNRAPAVALPDHAFAGRGQARHNRAFSQESA
jgi:hypothetical protein